MTEAFLKGYLNKEAFIAAMAPTAVSIALPEVFNQYVENNADKEIKEFRKDLGLKPLNEADNADLKKHSLQEQPSENKLSITQ